MVGSVKRPNPEGSRSAVEVKSSDGPQGYSAPGEGTLSTAEGQSTHGRFAIRRTEDTLRMIKLPRETAGVARSISPTVFFPTSLNSGPDWTTKTSPSSL